MRLGLVWLLIFKTNQAEGSITLYYNILFLYKVVFTHYFI